MAFYKITGLDQGYDIEPIFIELDPLSDADQNRLDRLLYVGNNDACRYYEEITIEEYRKGLKAKVAKYMKDEFKFSEEQIDSFFEDNKEFFGN